MDTIHTFFAILCIAGGSIAGVILAGLVMDLWRWMVRDTDKNRIKTAMMKEDYYNQLYEECLTEEMDKKAEQAAKEMRHYDYYS